MGQPKLWLRWGAELMVHRVLHNMLAAVPHVALAAAAGQAVPRLPDRVDLLRDQRPQRGPLEGLKVGLLWAERKQLDAVFAIGCDMPLLGPAVVRLTLEQLAGADAAVWFVHGRLQPLAAAYHVGVVRQIEELLARGHASMMELLEQLRCNIIAASRLASIDASLASFQNINTLDQYRKLLRDRAAKP